MLHTDESINRQIFINISPVNSVTGGGYLEVFPLFLRGVAQTFRLSGNINPVIFAIYSQMHDCAGEGHVLNVVRFIHSQLVPLGHDVIKMLEDDAPNDSLVADLELVCTVAGGSVVFERDD